MGIILKWPAYHLDILELYMIYTVLSEDSHAMLISFELPVVDFSSWISHYFTGKQYSLSFS